MSWATAWRIARRDLNARFKGLRLLLVCPMILAMAVATVSVGNRHLTLSEVCLVCCSQNQRGFSRVVLDEGVLSSIEDKSKGQVRESSPWT